MGTFATLEVSRVILLWRIRRLRWRRLCGRAQRFGRDRLCRPVMRAQELQTARCKLNHGLVTSTARPPYHRALRQGCDVSMITRTVVARILDKHRS